MKGTTKDILYISESFKRVFKSESLKLECNGNFDCFTLIFTIQQCLGYIFA